MYFCRFLRCCLKAVHLHISNVMSAPFYIFSLYYNYDVLIINRKPPSQCTRSKSKDCHSHGHIWLYFILTWVPSADLPWRRTAPTPVCQVCRGHHLFQQCPQMTGGCFRCGILGYHVSHCSERQTNEANKKKR